MTTTTYTPPGLYCHHFANRSQVTIPDWVHGCATTHLGIVSFPPESLVTVDADTNVVVTFPVASTGAIFIWPLNLKDTP